MPPTRLQATLLRAAAFAFLLLGLTFWRFFLYIQRVEAQRLVAAWDRHATAITHTDMPVLPPGPLSINPSLCPAVNQRSHYAIVALFLSTEDAQEHARYQEAAVKLGHSILHYSPRALLYADMILLLTPGAHPVDKFALNRAGWALCMVDVIASPLVNTPNRFHRVGMFTRLQVWRLHEYDAVLSLDLDTLVVADLSPLFTESVQTMHAEGMRLAAVPDSLSPGPMPFCGLQENFNAGVLLLIPSLDTHNVLVSAMQTVEYDIDWAEQGLLNALFPPGTYLVLPFRYNARVAEAGCSPLTWRTELITAAVLHFTVVKGWAMREWHPAWLGAVAWGTVHACFVWEIIGREPRRQLENGLQTPPLSTSRMTCKHTHSFATTVVTGLWDINREHRGDGRSFASYVHWLEHTLQINAPFLVFAPAKILARVRRARDATGYATCYFPLELRDTPYHQLFAADVQALLGSATYRWHNHHPFRVEAVNADYNILQWTKIYLLSVAQNDLNPFQSSSVMWVDAGLSRFTLHGLDTPFPQPRVVEKLLSRHPETTLFLSGGVFAYADQAQAEARCHDQMQWTGDNLFQGGLIMANGSTIAAFEKVWRSFIQQLLQKKQTNNDQVLLSMLWCTDPGWFSVIDVPGTTETGSDFLRVDDFFWGRTHGTVSRYSAAAKSVRGNAHIIPSHNVNTEISMVVAATERDTHGNLDKLIASVNRQYLKPMEVIIVVSGVGGQQCNQLERRLRDTVESDSRVLCIRQLHHQSYSRDLGMNTSRGRWIAFVDADDEIFPQYFQVVQRHITEKPQLVLILHGFTNQRHLQFRDRRLFDGNELYYTHIATRTAHPWILPGIMHSYPVVRTDTAIQVRFSTDPQDAIQEDCKFVRDVIDLIGDNRDAMLFDNAPLTWYVRTQDKKWYAWHWLASFISGKQPPDISDVDLHLSMPDYHPVQDWAESVESCMEYMAARGVDLVAFHENQGQNNKLYEHPEMIPENATIIEAGGFTGQDFGVFFRNAATRGVNLDRTHVEIFEPHPALFQQLHANIGECPEWLKTTNSGLGDKNTTLCMDQQSDAATTLESPDCPLLVPVMDIAAVIQPYQQINLLHINCEGCELPILRRVLATNPQKIQNIEVQFHRNHVAVKDYCDTARALVLSGYRRLYHYAYVWEAWSRTEKI
jgi:FkbM family methyltransferase